jgi:hypothetical protein
MQRAGTLRYVGPPRPGPLLNRPLGTNAAIRGSRLKLTVVRRIGAGHRQGHFHLAASFTPQEANRNIGDLKPTIALIVFPDCL